MSVLSTPAAAGDEEDEFAFLDTPAWQALLAERAKEMPTTRAGIEEYLNAMPLLATSKPTTPSPHFDAIDALISETPIVERIDTLKQSGNSAYKLAQALTADAAKAQSANQNDKREKARAAAAKRYDDALVYYQQALDVVLPINTLQPQPLDRIAADVLPLLSQAYANRALIHLQRGNYGKCIEEGALAIHYDHQNSKAYYRAASALLRLEKFDKANLFIQRGLQCEIRENERQSLIKLQDEIQRAQQRALQRQAELKKAQKQKQAEALATQKKLTEEKQTLITALQERGLAIGPPLYHLAGEQSPYNAKASISADGSLTLPVLLLYPHYNTSDFIAAVNEMDSLQTHLNVMFPPNNEFAPWDTEHLLILNNIQIFIEFDQEQSRLLQKEGLDVYNADEDGDDMVVVHNGCVRVSLDAELSLLVLLTSPSLQRRHYQVPDGVVVFTIEPKQLKVSS